MKKEIELKKKYFNDVEAYFFELLSPITIKHQRSCNCQKELYKKFYSKAYNDECDLIREQGLNESARKNRLENVKWTAMEMVADHCERENIRCTTEMSLLALNLSLFSDRYDLGDPRVYTIVNNALELALTKHRLNMDQKIYDVAYSTFSKTGQEYRHLNPTIDASYKYSEACIKAIETLNKIMEGETHKLEITERKTFQDILLEMKKVDLKDEK